MKVMNVRHLRGKGYWNNSGRIYDITLRNCSAFAARQAQI